MKKASVAVGGLFRLSAGTLLEKHRAGVAIATVEEDNDNHATLQRAGQFHGSLQGRTARDVSTGNVLSDLGRRIVALGLASRWQEMP